MKKESAGRTEGKTRREKEAGLKMTKVEVPLRIYLQKLQGRKNIKHAFSLGNFTSGHS